MKRSLLSFILLILLSFCLIPSRSSAWGFYSHRKINRMAIFTLPPEMVGFFKKHIDYLTEHAIDPDKRAHGVDGEAPKHYLDVEHFGDDPFAELPHRWNDAVKKYTEDSLMAYGILPWWIEKMSWKLTQAFKDGDKNLVLWYAANYGHYIADATVPLHTSLYYDGKVPAQKGIHAFWETRVPELYADNYDFLVGRAEYIDNITDKAWQLIEVTHGQVDTVYLIDAWLSVNFPEDKRFVMDNKGTVLKKQFSMEYCEAFADSSNDMVQRNMQRAILSVGSFWYTCWVNAGQPDLSKLDDRELNKEIKEDQELIDKMWRTGKPKGRPNPTESED